MNEGRTFPVLIGHGTDAVSPVRRIPWSIAERAYMAYARRYGTQQSLERLGERGGFGAGELDELVPGWREEVSEIARLTAEVARLRQEVSSRNQRALDGDLAARSAIAMLARAEAAEAEAARYREALEAAVTRWRSEADRLHAEHSTEALDGETPWACDYEGRGKRNAFRQCANEVAALTTEGGDRAE